MLKGWREGRTEVVAKAPVDVSVPWDSKNCTAFPHFQQPKTSVQLALLQWDFRAANCAWGEEIQIEKQLPLLSEELTERRQNVCWNDRDQMF